LHRPRARGKGAPVPEIDVTTPETSASPPAPATAPVLKMDPAAPDPAVIRRALAVFNAGGVVAFPTDTLYGIGCLLGRTEAKRRIEALRQIDPSRRPFSFLLPDLGVVPHYAVVKEHAYRLMSRIFPGPYCVELVASPKAGAAAVPGAQPTIGVRIPGSPFCEKLLWALGRPVLTVTAKSRGGDPLSTAQAIADEYGTELDLIIDGGEQTGSPSTVISLIDDWVAVLREGRGPTGPALLA
jgi:tRNA threonylcarbamoyl adenosine modification protein (Sua5/YciO/YrdC/YwlC family)